mmetsp:Transcript_3623/g.6310  ORF Transcript_3623/g.6310 Transcript_3623/m.6310 type:complete len:109 (+) Transcript_3623:282-608(+)
MSPPSWNEDREENIDPLLSFFELKVTSSPAKSEASNDSRRALVVKIDGLLVERLAVDGDLAVSAVSDWAQDCDGTNPMLDLTRSIQSEVESPFLSSESFFCLSISAIS